MMQSQKFLVYLSPLFGLFGLTLPLGVLIYWVTTNTWTLAQSHYVYKKYPMATPEGQQAAGTAKTGTAKTGTAKTGTAKTGTGTAKARTGAGAAKAGANSTARPATGLLGKARKKTEPEPEPEPEPEDTPPVPKVVRQQPTRQSRSKRKR
jgi:membrane protein insertase Oxa1/YidC/SpoIIIJ